MTIKHRLFLHTSAELIGTQFLFSLGLSLLLINLAGLYMPLRYEHLEQEQKNEIRINTQVLITTANADATNLPNYLQNLNSAVHDAICHDWSDANIDRYHLRVPIYENYVLWILSYIYPTQFKKYEFTSLDKAIERGVGLCSQHAIILDGLLDRKAIGSRIVRLSGHVVVTAKINNQLDRWWILDPDFGVTVKHDLKEIEAKPQLIDDAYRMRGYDDSVIEMLEGIYAPRGNSVTTDVRHYVPARFFVEKLSYILIWLIPALCMTPYIIKKLKKRHADQSD